MIHKVPKRLDAIIAQCLEMEKSGRLRPKIFCKDSSVFVLNQDYSMLLKFDLRNTETKFPFPVSFKVTDYDSQNWRMEGDKIVFVTEYKHYKKEMYCKITSESVEDVEKLFNTYIKDVSLKYNYTLSSELKDVLIEGLSHVEFSVVNGKLTLIQRDIYDGTLCKVESMKKGFGLSSIEQIKKLDVKPFALKTFDFLSLFSFQNSLELFIIMEKDYTVIKGTNAMMPFTGILSHCLFDGLGELTKTIKK